MSKEAFITHIHRLKRHITAGRLLRLGFSLCLIFLILWFAALILVKTGLYRVRNISDFAWLGAFYLLTAIVYTWRTRKSFLEYLIEIDARLDLKEKLSTAYEYYKKDSDSVFVDRLMEDAGRTFESWNINQLLPKTITGIHLLIPLLLIVNLILGSWEPSNSGRSRRDTSAIRKLEEKMERMKPPGESEARPPEFLRRGMDELAKLLEDDSLSKDKLVKSLKNLKETVERERKALARHTLNDLSLGDASGIPGLEPLSQDRPSDEQMERLQKQIDDMFDGRTPESLTRSLTSLTQSMRLEQALEETIEEAASLTYDEDRDPLDDPAAEETTEAARMAKETPGDRRTLPIPGRELKSSADTDHQADTSKTPGRPAENTPSRNDEPLNENRTPAAGRGPGSKTRQAPYELKRPDGPVIHEKGATVDGTRFHLPTKAQPAPVEGRQASEEVLRTYAREVESVLTKEDIPLSYREYIKNYFLFIGMENPDGSQPSR